MKFVGGLIAGLILAIVVGFNFYGWQTRSTSEQEAQAAMKHSAMCVAEFVHTPDYEKRRKELTGKSSFEFTPYIEQAGWGKSAAAETRYPYAPVCAEAIEVLLPKNKVSGKAS